MTVCSHDVRFGPNPYSDAQFLKDNADAISAAISDAYDRFNQGEAKMTVRAKFKVTGVNRGIGSMPTGEKDENGRAIYGPCEVQTIALQPVYGNGDPEHENTKFWLATPSGSISLGTVNESAGRYFMLGEEYYVDFIKAN